ncbi:MAG: DUF1573 domain-containing protein [Bacteroidetes bacterium]|nr:DUF1573 domain-containing protein [Bacteroidota bacterium]MBP7476953.1 DUF1573 domain-containing protein [Chitinophagales bacterium]
MKKLFFLITLVGLFSMTNAQTAKKASPAKPKKTQVAAKATSAAPAAVPVAAQPAAEKVKGAGISFNTDDLDYGSIKKGSDPKRSFIITNTGTEPLIISGCSGSCGCTVPSCPKEPVLPGKTASIDVNYDTNRPGPFTKNVTVMSNATNEPAKVVKIHGDVTE